jgi:hypothetical protein
LWSANTTYILHVFFATSSPWLQMFPTLNFGLIDLCNREFELLALALVHLRAICMLDVSFLHGKDNECGARQHVRSPKHTLVRQIAME